MNVLVAGGSGFVGSHLATALVGEGHDVTGDDPPSATGRGRDHDAPTQVVRGRRRPELAGRTAARASRSPTTSCTRSIRPTSPSATTPARRPSPSRHGDAACAGSSTSAVSATPPTTSPTHLRSRRRVEEILSEHAPTVALRAGIVVGDGSVSWEILCQLLEHLPMMITPRWVSTRTQPIALDDIVAYLIAAKDEIGARRAHYDVGAPGATSYREMLLAAAKEMGKRRLIIAGAGAVPGRCRRTGSGWSRTSTCARRAPSWIR